MCVPVFSNVVPRSWSSYNGPSNRVIIIDLCFIEHVFITKFGLLLYAVDVNLFFPPPHFPGLRCRSSPWKTKWKCNYIGNHACFIKLMKSFHQKLFVNFFLFREKNPLPQKTISICNSLKSHISKNTTTGLISMQIHF